MPGTPPLHAVCVLWKLDTNNKEEANMQNICESKFCDVSYLEEKNLVFVEWKKYCELDTYRKPLMAAFWI